MNPFSPLYYMRQNLARTATLIFVMSMAILCYLIGLYASNPYEENVKNIEFYRDFAVIATRDVDGSKEQLQQLIKDNRESLENEGLELINVDYYADSTIVGNLLYVNYFSGVLFDTVMDFKGGVPYPVFHDSVDFQKFADVLGIPYNGEDNAIIMGDKLAKHFSLEKGDTVTNDQDMVFGFKNALTLVGVFDKSDYGVPGQYTYFRVDSSFKTPNEDQPNAVLLLRKKGTCTEIDENRARLAQIIAGVKEEYKTALMYIDYSYNERYVNDTFQSFLPIFTAILTIIGAVLALTSVGIFSVALEKREFEFSVYNAIGFSRTSVLLKGIAEILILNLASIIVGVIIMLITVTTANELALFERGQELYYFSDMSFISYIVCNLAITTPLVVMQIYRILKSTVVRY